MLQSLEQRAHVQLNLLQFCGSLYLRYWLLEHLHVLVIPFALTRPSINALS